MKNKKGFTLIELLAVIVILGLLMAIAIPSVTKYITQSRKKTVTTTIGNYISALTNQVNDMEYTFTATNTIYAVPIECISVERGGTNPFGEWHQASNSYWAYVLVQYDDATSSYTYGFTFKDSAGYGIYPTTSEKLSENGSQIQQDLSLTRPTTGTITNITARDNWLGFDVQDNTNLIVLEAESEGVTGNGKTTCTLCQKGGNYEVVEEEKEIAREEALKDKDPIIAATSSNNTSFFWKYKSKIKTLTFESVINIPTDAVESWDVSTNENGQVMAYIKINSTDSSMYDLYIQGNGKIYANYNSSYMFYGFSEMTNIYNIELLDTSKSTNMNFMFSTCSALKSLDLSNFNTSNVTTMKSMFQYMYNIKALDLSSFNTSKVTNMSAMFKSMSRVSSLNVSSFDTSNVTDMSEMFSYSTTGITSLSRLDLSNFNTSKVTDMSDMFRSFAQYCSSATINISSFDTSNVTDMSNMFSSSNISSMDFSHFNTSKVKNMSEMFGWSKFKDLDLTSFNTSNVTNMTRMFFYTRNLNSLDVSSFNTSKVTSMYEMFGFTTLTSLDVSNFNTSNVTTMYGMFKDAKIKVLDLSNFDTKKVTSMTYMFGACGTSHSTGYTYFTNLNLSSFDFSSLKSTDYMFYGAKDLVSLDLSNANFSNITNYKDMFTNSKSGTNIYVKDDTAKNWILSNNSTAIVNIK